MARAMATAMADGNATEMVAAMVHGDHSNGRQQRQRQWAIATATATATVMATATATAMDSESEMAMAMAMVTGTARATMKEGLLLHVPAMCSAFGWATPCLHPHGHKQKVHSPALHHGGDTAKSVSSPSRGRVPDS